MKTASTQFVSVPGSGLCMKTVPAGTEPLIWWVTLTSVKPAATRTAFVSSSVRPSNPGTAIAPDGQMGGETSTDPAGTLAETSGLVQATRLIAAPAIRKTTQTRKAASLLGMCDMQASLPIWTRHWRMFIFPTASR